MKSIISFIIKILRACLYNTTVRNWRITAYIYSKVSQLQSGGERYPIIPFEGVNLKVDARDGILTSGLANNHFERFTIHTFRSLLLEVAASRTAGQCVLADIGANIGIFTTIPAGSDPKWRVVAFEPNPETHQLLVDNIALNSLTNVSPLNVAVGAEEGVASLDVSSENAGLHSLHGTGSSRIDVRVLALDDYFPAGAARPAVIKIDVEGYEPLVLKGMKSILAEGSVQLVMEFNPELLKQGGKSPQVFLQELADEFDAIYCLDETKERALPYRAEDRALEKKICSLGFNLLLVKGKVPNCIGAFSY